MSVVRVIKLTVAALWKTLSIQSGGYIDEETTRGSVYVYYLALAPKFEKTLVD